jgi:glutathione S-transferase
MQGQANHFVRYAKERIPYPIQRYVGETERLYSVLNTRLSSRDFIAGSGKGKYSIADIATFGWVNSAYWGGIDLDKFPAVKAWWARCYERPAVKAGLKVPSGSESAVGVNFYRKKLEEDSEFAEKERQLRETIEKSKEQYGYKFAPV